MQFLKTTKELCDYLSGSHETPGCLADTGFLYALSYTDDLYYQKAIEVFDVLASVEIPIYANVISRMEFIDLIFRKQLTQGAIKVFEEMTQELDNRKLFNHLKNIRDQDSANRKVGRSFKIGERKLKDLRDLINSTTPEGWTSFCHEYAGEKLFNEWQILEEELGLNFVEVMEGETSEIFNKPLKWTDMVNVMAKFGLPGTDAMIFNLYMKSKFRLLITTDSDFEISVLNDMLGETDKAVFTL